MSILTSAAKCSRQSRHHRLLELLRSLQGVPREARTRRPLPQQSQPGLLMAALPNLMIRRRSSHRSRLMPSLQHRLLQRHVILGHPKTKSFRRPKPPLMRQWRPRATRHQHRRQQPDPLQLWLRVLAVRAGQRNRGGSPLNWLRSPAVSSHQQLR